MKNQIAQFLFATVAFFAAAFLMSYTRPAAEEPKEYIIVRGSMGGSPEKFEAEVNKKLAEGWHVQGGLAISQSYSQAMVK